MGVEFTETITAATVVRIINNSTNTTRTTTITNELPPGITPPATNEAGTRVETVTITRPGNVTTETVV
ncbi:MAG: hypothetical protein M1815_004018 [Lichina confinis]|nr:MAG: hypothetical protein M1815_004018 [Lichina confinis]